MDTKIALVLGLSFVISLVLYRVFVPIFRKVKLGQKILEIGPAWHKVKEGVPTMGGLFFILASLLVTLFFVLPDALINEKYSLLAVLALALVNGLIGFVDDYVKLFKKRNKGLSASQKLILQFLAAAAFLWFLSAYGGHSSALTLPGGKTLELGVFYYFVAILVIAYMVNCANLTDGIDGLAGSVAAIIAVLFFFIASKTLDTSAQLVTTAILGGLLGFLVFNFHPAKVFMGDTGSLYLGGLLVGFVFYFRIELLIFLIGLIWLLEGLSVVIQVTSFKLTGKRIFKMSPIHHHFEMCGWSEFKIVTVFSTISALACGAVYWLFVSGFLNA